MNYPHVSVVVPAFNAQKTIAQNLFALQQQTYSGKTEIILVDDGSKDQTGAIARSFSEVIYVHQSNAGPAAARNKGISVSSGEIIFFTDSDCIPHKNWIEIMVESFSREAVAAVAGSYDIANPKAWLAWCIYREIWFRHHSRMPDYPKSFGTYNVAIRRQVLDDLGGFNEQYRFPSGEDNDLSYKIIQSGKKIFFERKSLVCHFFPTNLKIYLSQQYQHGLWRVRMYLDHPIMAKGDDYTFWKDIVEPLVVILITISLFLSFLIGLSGLLYAFLIAFFLFCLEIVFAFLFLSRKSYVTLYSMTMFFRSFSRTAGFILGLFLAMKSFVFKLISKS